MSLQPGQILNERYRIVRIIKSGGMGSVYEAIDTKLADSPCAVKEIHEAAQASRDAEYIQGRFYEEMKALVALDHGSIPKVRDYLTVDSTIYIVMELVQGRSLDEEIQERVKNEAPPSIDHIVLDMVRLLETLDYLHRQDPPVIHRDIKPANILRDQRSGTIKLVDFGLARTLHGPNTQTVVGTMGYCAPEQLMGKSEQRSDIYAVGVTLVHMLTGKAPEMELFEARRPDLPGVRPGLVDIIERATQPKPQDRYSNAQEMIDALQSWLHRPSAKLDRVVTAPMPVAVAAAPLAIPAWAGKALAACIVLGSLGLGVWAGQKRTPPPASQALTPKATPAVVAKAKPQPKKVVAAKPKPKPAPVVASYPQPAYRPQPAYQPPPRPAPARPAPKPAPVYHAPAPVVASYTPPPVSYRKPKRANRPSYQQPYREPRREPDVQVRYSGGNVQVSAPRVERQVQQVQRVLDNPIRGISFP